MSTLEHLDDQIIGRYLDQPVRLPADLRRQIEAVWDGAPVQLYALADLDHTLRLVESWVALGPRHVAVARRTEAGTWEVASVERARVKAVREAPGLSANTLTLLGEPGEPALALARYTHRQRRAFENIRFVLEEQLEGREIPLVDPDRAYADGVARPVREAQALVSGREVAVIRRLLGYLRPYRRQLTLGMAAATLITVVSLVPPYLAGYLIDRVVRPAQEGALPLGRAGTIAWLAVLAMALVYVVRQGAAVVRLRLMSILGEWVARDLRAELYEHIQRLSLAFFSRKRTGSLITRVSADTDRLWDFLAFGVVDVSLSLVMLAGLGAVLLSLDWRLGLAMTLLMLAVHGTTVVVWALALPRLLGGGTALPVGTFVSFLLYTTMFIGPIEVIGQIARTMNRATTSAHRVFEVLDTEPEVRDDPEPVQLRPVHGRVTFEHVTFGYDGVRQVLRGVSFDVTPGELIGLVGPSGGGKTTIVNLIARFYDVSGG